MFAYCQEMPGITKEMASGVEAAIGDAPVAGLVAHVAGPTASGWRIIDVWESEEDYRRFETERLQPAVQVATNGHTPPSRPFDFLSVDSANGLSRRA
jgi:hypothetical protein